jgi:hypothetical protein
MQRFHPKVLFPLCAQPRPDTHRRLSLRPLPRFRSDTTPTMLLRAKNVKMIVLPASYMEDERGPEVGGEHVSQNGILLISGQRSGHGSENEGSW